METTSALTIEDLKRIKHENFQKAKEDGSISACYQVGRELGRSLSARYGPKYQWQQDGVFIYVDDYGSYMTVHVGGEDTYSGGKEVCSTHPTNQLFVAGEWMNIVYEHLGAANDKAEQREQRLQEAERQRLLAQLGLKD